MPTTVHDAMLETAIVAHEDHVPASDRDTTGLAASPSAGPSDLFKHRIVEAKYPAGSMIKSHSRIELLGRRRECEAGVAFFATVLCGCKGGLKEQFVALVNACPLGTRYVESDGSDTPGLKMLKEEWCETTDEKGEIQTKLDDSAIYQLRCILTKRPERGREHCPPKTDVSDPTRGFRLAAAFDPDGTKNRTISITAPDLRRLAGLPPDSTAVEGLDARCSNACGSFRPGQSAM